MSARIQAPLKSLPIAPEDLAELGVDAQHIPFVVAMTLRVEQSPDGISLTEVENLIEILDEAVSSASAHPSLKDKCLGVLHKVSQTHRVLPKSYFPPGVTLPSDPVPYTSGGFADIWKGQLDGNDVCIKAFRVQTTAKPEKIKQRFYREIVGWKHVSHPNVLPFLGISEMFPFCLISPWLPNGNITEYIRNRPEVNRLQLLAQAACGLEHLHSLSIVHSNITPGNILITEEGDARIGDFGITTDPDVLERDRLVYIPRVIRYMAPELLSPKQIGFKRSNPSKETDVYSFAMTAYKVLSGKPPYGGEQDGVTALRIVSGIRPPRPNNPTASQWLPDKVWNAIQSCWAQTPQSRLPIHSLYQELAQVGQGHPRTLPQLDKSPSQFSNQLHDLRGRMPNEDTSDPETDDPVAAIEHLDKILDGLDPADPTFGPTFQRLRDICISQERIPSSHVLAVDRLKTDENYTASGGFSDVFHGTYNGLDVCIKRLRVSSTDIPGRMLYREALIWKRLIHPNIVPFIGVTSKPLQIVSEWMSGGNLTAYIKWNPRVDRVILLVDVAKGLDYLHLRDVVHGDLKGPNIMVDAHGCARITDFGLTRDQSAAKQMSTPHGGTARWTAPEISDGQGKPSKKADVFSFAMVMVEVFTGSAPFDLDVHLPITATLAIMGGERPPRPSHPDFMDELWVLMQRCWSQDPHLRPDVSEVVRDLHSPPPPSPLQRLHRLKWSSPDFHDQLSNVLDDEEYKRCVPNLRGDDLARFVDCLDEALGSLDPTSSGFWKCLRELRNICDTRMMLPTSYTLSLSHLNIGRQPVIWGDSDDVYEGTLDGSRVCVKRVRVYSKDIPKKTKTTKAAYQEVVVWKYLKHQNIVPLLGVTSTPLQLISEWMPGGNLTEYVKKRPGVDRLNLLSGVAKGLHFLHSNNIVHGDLKGPNILVDVAGHARITGFRFATVIQNSDSMWSDSDDQGPIHITRWTAPEILNEQGTYSKEGDVFSFAMVTIEVFIGAVPFDDSTTAAALLAIMDGERPRRPSHPSFTDELWTLTQRCWDQDPHSRPEVSGVLNVLGGS